MSDFQADWIRAARASDANPSFADLIRRLDPDLLPLTSPAPAPVSVPVGTTILALRFATGVVVAGDRRATEGYQIADRRIEKVFPADEFSAVAIAGAAGPAIDLVRLFQTELEHYEKVEGEVLSLEGKANKLAQLIKMNFPMALQGLVVVPLFAGFDRARGEGRIFRYDAVGGRYEDIEYHATGSGGTHARGSLKKRWSATLDAAGAVGTAVEALIDASDEDTATAGPDVLRRIYPTVAVVDADGYRQIPDDEVAATAERLMRERGGA